MTYLEQFCQDILNGNLVVSSKMKKTAEEGNELLKKYPLQKNLAHLQVKELENFANTSLDPFTNKPLKLMLWQKALLEIYWIKKYGGLNE